MYVYIFIVIILIANVDGARILAVFPTPSFSHQVVFRPITQELANRGHDITVITTDPAFPKDKAPANLTEIDLHNISYTHLTHELFKTVTSKHNYYMQMKMLVEVITSITVMQLKCKEIQDVIRDKKFDLLLVEAFGRPMVVLSHILKIPTVQVSSFGSTVEAYEIFGAPRHPILYHSNRRQKLNNLTIWEELLESYKDYWYEYLQKTYEPKINTKLRNIFGPDIPDIRKLLRNVDVLCLNVHPIWEGNRPVPKNVMFMRGVVENPKKDLPPELKTYMDSSKNGVIYFSLGSNIHSSMLPSKTIKIMMKVLSELPYEVLWKSDKETLPEEIKNIKIAKWLSQADILKHPNTKLFITQGGLQSIDEAIEAGVPLIGIPMFADQWFNIEKCVSYKIGLKLDIESFTEDKFKRGIRKVIEDDSYRDNIVRLRSVMQQAKNSLRNVIKWIEYTLKFKGAKHLRAPGVTVTWIEFLLLDVIAAIVTVVLLTVYFSYSLLVYLIKNT